MPLIKNKLGLILISILLLTAVAAVVFLLRDRDKLTEHYKFDEQTQEFKKQLLSSPDPNLTDLKSTNEETSVFTQVLKGYFHEYNNQTKILSLKNEFVSSSDLQLLTVSLDQISFFYCWPSTISNNGITIETKSMEFYVYPNKQDIIMPGEKHVSFDLLENFLQKNQYLIIQLVEPFDIKRNVNQVQKLILLDC